MAEANAPRIVAGQAALLARRYALAFFELAQEKGELEAIAAELASLQEAIQGNDAFWTMAKNARLGRDDLMAAMRSFSKEVKLGALTSRLLEVLAENRRLNALGNVVDAFDKLLADKKGIHRAEVSSAKALSDAQKDKLVQQLGVLVGGKVVLSSKEDPALLGGLTIKIGSRLIDASVKGKLAHLERQLKAQQEAA